MISQVTRLLPNRKIGLENIMLDIATKNWTPKTATQDVLRCFHWILYIKCYKQFCYCKSLDNVFVPPSIVLQFTVAIHYILNCPDLYLCTNGTERFVVCGYLSLFNSNKHVRDNLTFMSALFSRLENGKSDKEILDDLLRTTRYDKRLLPPFTGWLISHKYPAFPNLNANEKLLNLQESLNVRNITCSMNENTKV